jgi:hypothetical protein
MPTQFEILLKNERVRSINTVSLIICLVSALFFLIQVLKQGRAGDLYLLPFLVIVCLLVYKKLSHRKRQHASYRLILIICAVSWFTMPLMPWLGLPVLLLAMFEEKARMPIRITFTNDLVVLHTLFTRNFGWQHFNNVVLKDRLLTLDLKNNRLIQRIIQDEDEPEQEEFNKYCSERLVVANTSPGGNPDIGN